MHLYSVDIKLAQGPNFEKKSYLDDGEKFYYVVEKDNYLIWCQGFHIGLTVCTVCIAKVMQFLNKPESILLFEPILKHTV
jgi:hypothetical protein